ncbi:MAG TPA: polyprenol phosphomannose-dependent alpha 1,6 mannosyltransferase MptB [Streptosporangiaceae bacterium]|nr:polyprenol phosphomannose-dependent alpha 1,6 mannosyltransferase MptB [Streptosporangiaceae bacterium]
MTARPAPTTPLVDDAERNDTLAARRLGRTGLTLTAASFALTVVVALLGPSLMEPAIPGHAGQPPWSLSAHPSPYLIVALAGAAILTAIAGLIFSLNALRRSWPGPARLIMLAGILGAAVLAFLPPFGSSDHLSYAAYGRMAVTGHDPFTTTPAMLARLGDPVGRAVQDWRTSPSVYGPVAVAGQALAAWIGGTSVKLIVFVLSALNVAAFAGTGLILHWLTRGDRTRQLRVALLWTANPLLLLVLIAGAHVDAQAIVFGVAAVAVATAALRPEAGLRRVALAGVAVGALLGLGFAIKVTTALLGAGIAIGLLVSSRSLSRPVPAGGSGGSSPRASTATLAALGAGFVAIVVVALIPWGTRMFVPALRAGSFTSIGSPWRLVRSALHPFIGENAAEDAVKAASILLALALLILLLRSVGSKGDDPLPTPENGFGTQIRDAAGPVLLAGAFIVVFAWLLAWPYVLPWYDGLAWALLAALPASRLDWLLLARTGALAIGYLPARGIALPAGLGWLESVVRTAITPAALLVIIVLTALWLRAGPGKTGLQVRTRSPLL